MGERRYHNLRPIAWDLGDVVSALDERFGPIARAWHDVAGAEVARQALPTHVDRRGRLHITCATAAWAFEVRQLEAVLCDRLQARHAGLGVTGLVTSVGHVPRPEPPPPAPKLRPLSDAEEHAIDALGNRIDDPQVRAAVKRAMRATAMRENS